MFNFLAPVFYLRVSPQLVSIRNVRTGEAFSDTPELAIVRDPKARILAIGASTSQARLELGVEVINPFGHPRSMVSDFMHGEQVVRVWIKRMEINRFFAPNPRLVFHPLGEPEGGFTQVELRAFREMGLGAGAREVVMWLGPELTDAQILSGNFPSTGRVRE